MPRVLEDILGERTDHADAPPLAQWWSLQMDKKHIYQDLIDQSIYCGYHAPGVAWAFLAGYQHALQTLFGSPDGNSLAALCTTEKGSSHPAAIQTKIDTINESTSTVHGQKDFVSFADIVDYLYVSCSHGQTDNQNQIKVVAVPVNRQGVQIDLLPDLPFVSEAKHGRVTLNEVSVSSTEVITGDGFTDFVKPFRWHEDLHVLAALLAYLLSLSRRFDWETAFQERLLTKLYNIQQLAKESATSPLNHLIISGLWTETRQLLDQMEQQWHKVDEVIKAAWQRDRNLLNVANKVRLKRTERAWNEINPGS